MGSEGGLIERKGTHKIGIINEKHQKIVIFLRFFSQLA